MSNFNYNEWSNNYHNKKVIEISKYLDENDINILNRLGIIIEESLCSEYQYDIIKQQLYMYSIDDEDEDDLEIQKELKSYQKSLENTGVSQEEVDNLIDKLEKIDKKIYKYA